MDGANIGHNGRPDRVPGTSEKYYVEHSIDSLDIEPDNHDRRWSLSIGSGPYDTAQAARSAMDRGAARQGYPGEQTRVVKVTTTVTVEPV